MTRDEIQQLYEATRPGRRTKAQQRTLEHFGNLLVEGAPGLALRIGGRNTADGEDTP